MLGLNGVLLFRQAHDDSPAPTRTLAQTLAEVRGAGVEPRDAEVCTWCAIPCEALTATCIGGPAHVLRVASRDVARLEALGLFALRDETRVEHGGECERRHVGVLLCERLRVDVR